MVENLSQEQVNEFKYTFELFDEDQNGTISAKELGSVMRKLGHNPSEEEVKQMIAEVDTDNSGSIDFNEFLALMARKMKSGDAEEELKQAFKAFDKDNNGFISASQLESVMNGLGQKLSKEDIQQMIKEADLDGDGQINYQEFVRIMSMTK